MNAKTEKIDNLNPEIKWVDPRDVVCKVDPEHWQFDPAFRMKINPTDLEDVRQRGIHTPIRTMIRNGKRVVIFGNNRTAWGRVLTEENAKANKPPHLIPVIDTDANSAEAFALMASENAHRRIVNPMETARLVVLSMTDDVEGDRKAISESNAAVLFRCDVATIKRYHRLTKAAPEVQKAIEDGRISFMAGDALAKLKTHEEQVSALQKALNVADAAGHTSEKKKRKAASEEAEKASREGRDLPERDTPTRKERDEVFTLIDLVCHEDKGQSGEGATRYEDALAMRNLIVYLNTKSYGTKIREVLKRGREIEKAAAAKAEADEKIAEAKEAAEAKAVAAKKAAAK